MPELGLSAALFLAGLGFFFSGLDGLKTNLRQLATRRFRSVVSRFTDHPLLAAVWGVLLGTVSQSASLVSFIMVGMVASGLLPIARALLVVAWANLGTVVLVFLAAVDILAAVYLLIGITGILVAFRLVGRYAAPMRTMYSLGVLFLGLRIMRDATVALPEFGWFTAVVAFLKGSNVLAFLLGAAARTVIQSSSAIVVIALTLSSSGLLEPHQVLLVMYGAAVGVGLSVLLLSANVVGLPRQIAIFQAAINVAAGLVFLGLFELERFSGVPLLMSLLDRSALGDPSFRLALCFLIQQTVVVFLGTLAARRAAPMLERWSPPTTEQDLSRPRFVGTAVVDEPGTALLLAEKEQHRILELVPDLLLDALGGAASKQLPSSEISGVCGSLDTEIKHYLEELVESQQLDPISSQRLLQFEERQRMLMNIAQATAEFAEVAARDVGDPRVARLVSDLTESLHGILLTAVDTFRAPDEFGLSLLGAMTSDRGDMMSEVRAKYVAASETLAMHERSGLLFLTTLFERIVWMLNRMVAQSRAALGESEDVIPRGEETIEAITDRVGVGSPT